MALWIDEPRVLFGDSRIFEIYPFNAHWNPNRIANAAVRLLCYVALASCVAGAPASVVVYAILGSCCVTVIAKHMATATRDSQTPYRNDGARLP